MTISNVKAGGKTTLTVQESQALSIMGSADTVGVVYRLNDALGGGNSLQSWQIGAGAMVPIGPFEGTSRFLITCAAGTIAATVAAAVLSLAGSSAGTVATITGNYVVGQTLTASYPAGTVGTIQFTRTLVASPFTKTLISGAVANAVNSLTYQLQGSDAACTIAVDCSNQVSSAPGGVCAPAPGVAPVIVTAPAFTATPQENVPLAFTSGSFTGATSVLLDFYRGVTLVAGNASGYTPAVGEAAATYTIDAKGVNSSGTTHNMSANSAACLPAAATPSAPSISSVADSGATSHTVTLAAPSSNGGSAITDYPLVSATVNGVADPKVWDMSAGTISTTRVLMGATPGRNYVYTFAAKNANGTGPASAASTARAMPSWSVAPPTPTPNIMWGKYGLPFAVTHAVTTDTSFQIGLGGLPFDFDGIAIVGQNCSRTAPATLKWSVSSPPVLGTYPLQGATVGAGGLPALNNGGTWVDGANLSIPVSGAATDADALYGPGAAQSEFVNITSNARTDGGAGKNLLLRVVIPAGSEYNQTTWMPSVVSGSNWYPGQEVVGGQLNGMTIRVWYMGATDAIANKAAFTAAGTFAYATRAPMVFIVFRLKGVVQGYQLAFPDDSRGVFGIPALNNPMGTHLLSWAQICSATCPAGFVDLGLSGQPPSRWAQLWNAVGSFIPVGTGIVSINSINSWGGYVAPASGVISTTGYNANLADANTLTSNMKTQGWRVARSSVIGVDTINTSTYHWTNDIAQRHDTNRAAEQASTAALPVIPLGTLSEGPIETTNNSYTVGTRDGATNWLEQLDGTRAHPTNAWALAMYQYELAILKAGLPT